MGARIKVEGNSAVITGVDGYTGANLVAPDLRAGAALVIAALAAEGFSTIDDIKYICVVTKISMERSVDLAVRSR